MIGRTNPHSVVTAKIGSGGMGVVYEAEDTGIAPKKWTAAYVVNPVIQCCFEARPR